MNYTVPGFMHHFCIFLIFLSAMEIFVASSVNIYTYAFDVFGCSVTILNTHLICNLFILLAI